MKKYVWLAFFCVTSLFSFAQLQSPEAFLGYPIGTRFTPHHKIVSYFQYIAAVAPAMVRLQPYGETVEHRPLYLAFISSPQNIGNLEAIRLNNLRLAHVVKDGKPASEAAPPVVWMSYNVHGNEPASSEAALLTLFALVDPANTQTKQWLQHTVVVIDPCLNPDGRDRYVSWFNSVAGSRYNPQTVAREHREPWPYGRSNHYNFDLNRDWAWQTQPETRQRMPQYNQWLPQVHVDFHEQSYNDPYYFAPAAEPYHEVITPWQREAQKIIGRNNARYFDKQGWLYFTAQRFDLFYPSYGDTYPLYNGAIGMTYEQGGISGGLGVVTAENDTLTLADRAQHHFTTGISTIETASQNAGRLVKEFHQFFTDAVSGSVGAYKTYLIKSRPADAERIAALVTLLDNNGIQYGTASGSGRGYNYANKKEEAFTVAAGDLVISSSQPKAALVKVLFEPQSKLADSVTYDLTAWSLPYVYGLQAYASTEKMAVSIGKTVPGFIHNTPADAYGYVIRWQGVTSAKTVAALLTKGIRLRFTEEPFEMSGQAFGSGSVIITKKGNTQFGADLWKIVSDICNSNKVTMNAINTGMADKGADLGSNKTHLMKAPRVALLTGETVNAYAAGEIWNFFDNVLDYKISLFNAADYSRIPWNDIDVLLLPDGYYHFLTSKEPAASFEQWIRRGGKVIALESAVSQLSKQDWSVIRSKAEEPDSSGKKDRYAALLPFESRERDPLSNGTPGSIFKVEVDNTHPLMFGYPKYYYTLKQDNAVYNFIKEDGWNAGVIKREAQLAGYVGYKLLPKLKDGLLFGVQELGAGSVTYLTDDIIFRNFWENGKLMLCNAVFLVGQ